MAEQNPQQHLRELEYYKMYLLALRIIQKSLTVNDTIENVGELDTDVDIVAWTLHVDVGGQWRVDGPRASEEHDPSIFTAFIERWERIVAG